MFEVGKEYETRDGREARVYAIDGSNWRPIHGAIKYTEGWSQISWKSNGINQHSHCDLMPEKKKVWVAVWWAGLAGNGYLVTDWFETKQSALDWVGNRTLISLVEVEVPHE